MNSIFQEKQVKNFLKINFILLGLTFIVCLGLIALSPSYIYGFLFGAIGFALYIPILIWTKKIKHNKTKLWTWIFIFFRLGILLFIFISSLVFINQMAFGYKGDQSTLYPINVWIELGVFSIPWISGVITIFIKSK